MSRVVVAMSGGVDSAVAAALLVQAGHDVTGVHLELAHVPAAEQVPGQGCCTLDDAQDARRVADQLGIPFYVWDFRDLFASAVQEPFAAGYAAGTTPNPCVVCNERVKYAALLDRALALGFDGLATGHHARLRRWAGAQWNDHDAPLPGSHRAAARRGDTSVALHRAVDPRKDQSYVLHAATPEQLARTLLPVGEHTKGDVRGLAGELGLRVAAKPDSHDVCFIPDNDTAGYLGRHLPVVPGDVVDLDGTVLGRHEGIWHVTVGQRRGLGLATHEKRFVVDTDARTNTITVGPREALATTRLAIEPPTEASGDEVLAAHPSARVQVRAHGATVPGRFVEDVDGWWAELDDPVHGVAPGQRAVRYDATDTVCLGGAVVTRRSS